MTKQEFLSSTGLEGNNLEIWIEQKWLLPEQMSGEPTFSDADIARARLIEELRSDLGVNDEGVGVVLHLMDQLHGLRHALAELRKAFTDGAA